MWNDTDEPLAYFITFRTYGTWLHGDSRGSVSRHHNKYRTPKLRAEPGWFSINKSRMVSEPVILNARQRSSVKKAIKETCRIREWVMLAINVRTNHVHVVVVAPNTAAGKVVNALKANATRILRERHLWSSDKSPWVDKASNRYLWNERSVSAACGYVVYGQGEDLPEFD